MVCLLESRGPVALPVVWAHPLPTLSLDSGVTPTRKALGDSMRACGHGACGGAAVGAARTAVTAMSPSGQQVPSLLGAGDGDSGLQWLKQS